jgi:hypothetical protein
MAITFIYSLIRRATKVILASCLTFVLTACTFTQQGANPVATIEVAGRWTKLPDAVADTLLRESLDSSNLKRYVVQVQRNAFKEAETVVSKDTFLRCWRSLSRAVSECSFDEHMTDHLAEIDSGKDPFTSSYVTFAIRSFREGDNLAVILVLERSDRAALFHYFDLKMQWDGNQWQKLSLIKQPFPMPKN